jgi:hypothetical protein
MARELKNVENETQTLYDLEHSKKNRKKKSKIRNAHCTTWNVAKKSEKLGK